MKTLSLVTLPVIVLSSAVLVVNFALGISLFTTIGILAIVALDYSRQPRVLSVARTAILTREQARSERLRLAA